MPRSRKPRNGGQHGGPRVGAPGAQYQNRGDLQQAPRAVPGQTYGQAGQQLAAQQAQPLPGGGATSGAIGPATGAPAGGMGQSRPTPPPLSAPTQQPNTPLTAGIMGGAGPGPEAIGMQGPNPIDEIRAMYAANPNDDLRRLLAYLDGGYGAST